MFSVVTVRFGEGLKKFRYGRIVTVDDALFAHRMVEEFLQQTQKVTVTVHVRKGFVKSLIAFYKFLIIHIDPVAGERRIPIAKNALKTLRHFYAELKSEELKAASHKGIVSMGKPKMRCALYGAMRVVVNHRIISQKIEEIMKKFARNPRALLHVEYNFVMSALIAYIVVCSGSRNEVGCKTVYGSIVEEMEETAFQPMGLVKRVEASEDFWVVRFPLPKRQGSGHQETTCKSGLFVLDTKSYAWLQHYKKLRTFVVQKRGLERMYEENTKFFLLWGGNPVSSSSVPHLLRRFFITINCEEMKITCNSVRHAISARNYDESLDQAAAGGLMPVDPNIALLLGHSEEVQLRHYVDSWAKSAVKGYRLVEIIAEREIRLSKDTVAAAKRRVKFMGFSNVAMRLSDAEAEEDCGEREPYSADEEDGDVASDSSGYVASRPIPSLPADVPSTSGVRQSPRKRAKISPPFHAELSDESSNDGSEKSSLRHKPPAKVVKSKWSKVKGLFRRSIKGADPSGSEEMPGTSDQTLPQHLMLEGETIDASPDSPPETAPSAERWEALRIPVYQVRRPTGHVERKLPFSPSCAPEKPRALPSAPPLEHENPFEFVADDVRDRFPITPLFKGSTDWRLIAVDSVLSLLRRRQLNVVHAGLYHANALITAERLLLWVGIQSGQPFLRLDTSKRWDSFEAYTASRILLCPEVAHEYDPSAELYPYDENNQLSKLLTAADGDAFYKNRKSSVVIVLKPAAEIATVVLLGEVISPTSLERYSTCVTYKGSAESCFPIRRCLLNTEGPTLSEEFGGGELLHFRTRNDDMWAELLYKKNLELSHVIHVMRQYHNLEKL